MRPSAAAVSDGGGHRWRRRGRRMRTGLTTLVAAAPTVVADVAVLTRTPTVVQILASLAPCVYSLKIL